MVNVTWWFGVLVASGIVISGCVGEENTANSNSNGSVEPNVVPTHDSQTGAIEGQVLTVEQLPVAGAEVGLMENLTFTTTTNSDGRFAINLVPPGFYTVAVSAFGFHPQDARVEVVAGTIGEPVLFTMEALPADGPYHETLIFPVDMDAVMWKLTPSCIYTDVNPLVKTCGGLRLACTPSANCEVHTSPYAKFTNEWKSLIGEVRWEAQSGVTGRGFNFDLNAPNITRGSGGSINQAEKHTWVVATDESPIQIRIDNPSTLIEREIPEIDWNNYPANDCTAPDPDNVGNCDWFFRLFAAACDLGICPSGTGPDYGIMYGGIAEIYLTYFIEEPAEPEWTALPEG